MEWDSELLGDAETAIFMDAYPTPTPQCWTWASLETRSEIYTILLMGLFRVLDSVDFPKDISAMMEGLVIPTGTRAAAKVGCGYCLVGG